MRTQTKRPITLHKGFPGGAILPNDKDLTEGLDIEVLPAGSSVRVCLDDGSGGTAELCIGVGEDVSAGECIGAGQSPDGVGVHSPVSGRIKQIEQISLADGSIKPAVTIDVGLTEQPSAVAEKQSWKHYGEGLIKCLQWAGITQMNPGGGSLVGRIRRAVKAGLGWVIINAVESEPLITSEARLMTEQAEEIACGCELLAEIFGLAEPGRKASGPVGIFALCGARHQAASAMRKALRGGRFRLAVLSDVYPQDEEVLLANTLTNARLRTRQEPANSGILLINVSSVWALSRAWYESKPLSERVITVAGDGTEKIGNYLVPIGTAIEDVIRHVGALPEACVYIVGGPFRGWAQDLPCGVITKNTTGLTVLTRTHRQDPEACIWCGWCSDDCPAKIDPLRLYQLVEAGRLDKAGKSCIEDCIECGLCSYVCPAHLPLLEKIRLGKWALQEKANGN